MTMVSTNMYILFYYVGARCTFNISLVVFCMLEYSSHSVTVYTVSMIASLNAREGLRHHVAEARGITTIPHIDSTSDHTHGSSGRHVVPKRHAHSVRLLLPSILL